LTQALAALVIAAASTMAAAQLQLLPEKPAPIDVVRLRYTHTGCTNADSVRLSQQSNRIAVQVDRIFLTDCGTTFGYFEEFTLGRLPAGEYDVELDVNPPPPTLGPTQLLGPVHLTVVPSPPTGSLHPHENYADMWWNPSESGWALSVSQSGERLVLVWMVYGSDGSATWFIVPSGAWSRNSDNVLHFSGAIYRVHGPPWQGAFDPASVNATAVGVADFVPHDSGHAEFAYTIDAIAGSKSLERFRF
jgi:hypothetical protein